MSLKTGYEKHFMFMLLIKMNIFRNMTGKVSHVICNYYQIFMSVVINPCLLVDISALIFVYNDTEFHFMTLFL